MQIIWWFASQLNLSQNSAGDHIYLYGIFGKSCSLWIFRPGFEVNTSPITMDFKTLDGFPSCLTAT